MSYMGSEGTHGRGQIYLPFFPEPVAGVELSPAGDFFLSGGFSMALVEVMYPIVSVRGKMGDALFTTTPHGIDLDQTRPLQRTATMKKRTALSKPCLGFKKADKIYSNWPEHKKQVWRDAVKKPGISGYTLWMKECLHLWGKGEYAPDVPSISGGYTYEKAIPGTTYPPPSD